MRIDWIRVYQPTDAINIGCDPVNFPTEAYINEYVLFFVLFFVFAPTLFDLLKILSLLRLFFLSLLRHFPSLLQLSPSLLWIQNYCSSLLSLFLCFSPILAVSGLILTVWFGRYIEAYTNPNLTTWRDDYKQPWPKNSFVETC